MPALNDVCFYINSCAENYKSEWMDIGEEIIKLLDHPAIIDRQYFKITLLNLFARNPKLNHINQLINRFERSAKEGQRKILLACANNSATSGWLLTLKESYQFYDQWTKYAFLIASKNLPREERDFFLKSVKKKLDNTSDIMEMVIIKWANKQL